MTPSEWLAVGGGGEGAATDWGHRWRYDPRDRTPWNSSARTHGLDPGLVNAADRREMDGDTLSERVDELEETITETDLEPVPREVTREQELRGGPEEYRMELDDAELVEYEELINPHGVIGGEEAERAREARAAADLVDREQQPLRSHPTVDWTILERDAAAPQHHHEARRGLAMEM